MLTNIKLLWFWEAGIELTNNNIAVIQKNLLVSYYKLGGNIEEKKAKKTLLEFLFCEFLISFEQEKKPVTC